MKKEVRYVQKDNVVYKEETNILGIKTRTRYGTVKNGKVKKDTSLFDKVGGTISEMGKAFKSLSELGSNKTNERTPTISSSKDVHLDYSFDSKHSDRKRRIWDAEQRVHKERIKYNWYIVITTIIYIAVIVFLVSKLSYAKNNVQCVYYASEGGYVKYNDKDTLYTEKIACKVKLGENCVIIEAVPKEGYKFSMWSDGVTTPERQDLNVQSAIEVVAYFIRDYDSIFINTPT